MLKYFQSKSKIHIKMQILIFLMSWPNTEADLVLTKSLTNYSKPSTIFFFLNQEWDNFDWFFSQASHICFTGKQN